MWFEYRQNNSGGRFIYNEQVAVHVFIEAESVDVADALAKARAGIYFNGVAKGRDCDCCGDRWYHAYSGTEEIPVPVEWFPTKVEGVWDWSDTLPEKWEDCGVSAAKYGAVAYFANGTRKYGKPRFTQV